MLLGRNVTVFNIYTLLFYFAKAMFLTRLQGQALVLRQQMELLFI